MCDVSENTDLHFMKEAIKQAKKAYIMGEVPIGCVVVYNGVRNPERPASEYVPEGRIVGRGYNRRNTDKSTLSHAEITAIRRASKALGDWRLEGCTIYVTLEPCQMCAGAMLQARADRVVIGCMNPKAGCAGSVVNLLQMDGFNHRLEITSGICEEECSTLLSSFFKELREKGRK